jgi:osmoprotectant transport system ATP-binding protein
LIRLEHVSKRYGAGHAAVNDLSLDIQTGDTCMLVGPSGCGKTTTLKMINRLVEPDSGRILVDDRDVTREDPIQLRLGIGYVIQQAGLFPHLSVADNVATVPRLLGWDQARVNARVVELLELVGLDPALYAKRYPGQLSGGQRQRVGVARALGADPPILLMDEPFGAVDRVTRDRLQSEFKAIQERMHKTVVFVTHDIDEAVKLGDRIALLSEGARLEQYDTPLQVLGHPASAFAAEFLGPDRAHKRLAVTPINPANLAPPDGGNWPRVPVRASLADALSEMLLYEVDRVAVMDDGREMGVLSLSAMFTTAREQDQGSTAAGRGAHT